MEISYLKNLERNTTLVPNNPMQGVSESAISNIEKLLGHQFPDSYKEFLFLAGDSAPGLGLFPGNSSLKTLAMDEQRDYLSSVLKTYGVLQERPIWVFTEMDGYEQFLFFYLDGETEDPIFGRAELTDVTKISESTQTFSEYINGLVDFSIEYQKKWGPVL